MLSLIDVNKTFQEGTSKRTVLSDISLMVEDGEFVAIQGPSGSGKSTLLNLIAGLDAPDSGSIEVSGVRIDTMSEHQRTLFRRKYIGFVFQFFSLIPTITVGQNVSLSLQLNHSEEDIEARTSELLRRIDLEDRRDSYPDRLSGGEQQRVAIARAIAHKPRLILADEPTGNLDAKTESGVIDLLEDLHAQRRTTLILATHSQTVAGRAGRTIRLQTDYPCE